jgi:transcriptional regulator with XRE-family HTH domain
MVSVSGIASQIKTLRKSAGLSIAELAARTGIPARSLVRMESGDPNAPIGRISLVLQSLGYGLEIVSSARPTLENLSSIYADDSDNTTRSSQ